MKIRTERTPVGDWYAIDNDTYVSLSRMLLPICSINGALKRQPLRFEIF